MLLNDITYSYKNHTALDQVTLQINEKSFSVLFGADDAGKTTLIHLIMGFVPKYQGEIAWETEKPPVLRLIPDDIIWEKTMTVKRYMKFAERAAAEYDGELQGRLCEEFSVPLDAQLLDLTYQENKMAQIITALCARPDFLILDEPMNFLDSGTYLKVLDLLQERNRKGMGILLAAEKYGDVRGRCGSYAYLKEGKIIASGEVPEPDLRKKIVTITGGRQESLKEVMEKVADLGEEKGVYLYAGSMEELPAVLREAGGRDFTVEELTLEEEMEADYSRWTEK